MFKTGVRGTGGRPDTLILYVASNALAVQECFYYRPIRRLALGVARCINSNSATDLPSKRRGSEGDWFVENVVEPKGMFAAPVPHHRDASVGQVADITLGSEKPCPTEPGSTMKMLVCEVDHERKRCPHQVEL